MSSDSGLPQLRGLEPAGPGAKVTRLELFYDLVFVYAFLNVTTAAARRLTPVALLASLLYWPCSGSPGAPSPFSAT